MRINFNEPKFGEEELKEVEDVIKSSFVNEGPKSKELEEKIKEYLGVKHVILTTSATASLFLAIKTDSIIKNITDFEVIVPDLTMIATATAVNWAGGKPILVDVKENGTIDPEKIKEKITQKTIAIIPVHFLGRSPDMNEIQNIANIHNLSIIEDAAGALGSKNNNKFLGTFGKVGCFSLQSNKIVACGQGGVIVTNDDQYYETMKRLKDFGRFDKEFMHNTIGYNLKFTDLSAALALAQFRKINNKTNLLVNQRRLYKQELSQLPEIKFINLSSEEIPVWVDVLTKNREELIEYLNSFEIYPRACWPSLHKNPPYQNQGKDEDFPNSSFISDNNLWLPNGSVIDNEKIKFICDKIKEFYLKENLNTNLQKIHEDERGFIYLVDQLLKDNKEFTFLEIKKSHARGGCLHRVPENYVVIKGKLKFVCGDEEKIVSQGESGSIPPLKPHAFFALEDSIVSEWGVTTQEKEEDKKDPALREIVEKFNRGELKFNY